MQLLLRKTLAFVVGCLLVYIFSAKTTGDVRACVTDLEASRPASSHSSVSHQRTECVSLMHVKWFFVGGS